MATLDSALRAAAKRIDRREAEMLAAYVLHRDRAWIISHGEYSMEPAKAEELALTIEARALGTPVAYLLGTREFYGRPFQVDQRVLIPRPETETLVEAALARVAESECNVLDLGTGSGALAVTLALERPRWSVTGTDASTDALDVAHDNSTALGANNAVFLHGSWYAPVNGWSFDLIVSNPPYIAGQDAHLAEGDLRFEPKAALTDGSEDGLDSLRTIINGAVAQLNAGGWLMVEHGYDQAEASQVLLTQAGFQELFTQTDLAGIKRVAGGRKL